MSKISITDNYNSYVSQYKGVFWVKGTDAENVKKIADKTLGKLKNDNPGLLIYPDDLGDHGDGLRSEKICSIKPVNSNVILETGNLMGYVGLGKTELHIFSRFDSAINTEESTGEDGASKQVTSIEHKNDFFMYYLLSRIGAINLFSLDFTKEEEGVNKDLLLLLFPPYFKEALSQGVYKEYRSFERNDSNVRGTIDVNRYMKQNIPFCGNIAYRAREHSFDNDLTQLIRHTIEYINESNFGNSVLYSDPDMNSFVDMIVQSTPSYQHNERQDVIARNNRPRTHPYYTSYIKLQELCLQILREEGLSFDIENESEDKIHGLLFDGAWLWESYIFTLLQEFGFSHPDNIARTDAFRMFESKSDVPDIDDLNDNNQEMYPDFYNENCVFDAKYKHLDSKIQRDDLFQIISYMHTLPRKIGGLIYPTSNPDTRMKRFMLTGYNGLVYSVPFLIPNYKKMKDKDMVGSWKNFCYSMRIAEENFKNNIIKITKNLL